MYVSVNTAVFVLFPLLVERNRGYIKANYREAELYFKRLPIVSMLVLLQLVSVIFRLTIDYINMMGYDRKYRVGSLMKWHPRSSE